MQRALQLWARLPALLRGAVIAFVILTIGQLPPGVFLAVGLKYTPAIPWWLPATIIWLCLFWMYLSRRDDLRANPLPARIWLWSLVAGSLGMISVLSAALLTGLVADLPPEAYVAPLDMSRYSRWTILAFFLTIAIMAGVVEEAAFRGYMMSIIQRRHGWWMAIISAAILFNLVHLSHAYATIAFVPFFMAYSALHGALVYLTRSILPSVVLHALGDFAILPIQYGVIRNPMGASVRLHVLVVIGFGVVCVLALRFLSGRVRT